MRYLKIPLCDVSGKVANFTQQIMRKFSKWIEVSIFGNIAPDLSIQQKGSNNIYFFQRKNSVANLLRKLWKIFKMNRSVVIWQLSTRSQQIGSNNFFFKRKSDVANLLDKLRKIFKMNRCVDIWQHSARFQQLSSNNFFLKQKAVLPIYSANYMKFFQMNGSADIWQHGIELLQDFCK